MISSPMLLFTFSSLAITRKESRNYFCNNSSLQFAILIFSFYKTRVRRGLRRNSPKCKIELRTLYIWDIPKTSIPQTLFFSPMWSFVLLFIFSSSKQKVRIFIPTVKLNRYWSILWGSSTHLCKGYDPRSSQDRKWNIYTYPHFYF